jgi:hypothetical protein
MLIDDYARQLSLELEMEELFIRNEQGNYSLYFDPGITVELEPLGKGFALRAVVGKVPPSHQEEFFVKLMLANLLGQGTGGAVLNLSLDGQLVFLTREVPYETVYVAFKDELETFLNFTEYWKREIGS